MHRTFLACVALIAVVATPALARKPGPVILGPVYTMSSQVDLAAGVDHLDILASNPQFPAVDLSGRVELWLDGALVATAELDALDMAKLEVDVPLASGAHALCLRFEGKATFLDRRGRPQEMSLSREECRALAS
jgi:hypothetical protein